MAENTSVFTEGNSHQNTICISTGTSLFSFQMLAWCWENKCWCITCLFFWNQSCNSKCWGRANASMKAWCSGYGRWLLFFSCWMLIHIWFMLYWSSWVCFYSAGSGSKMSKEEQGCSVETKQIKICTRLDVIQKPVLSVLVIFYFTGNNTNFKMNNSVAFTKSEIFA